MIQTLIFLIDGMKVIHRCHYLYSWFYHYFLKGFLLKWAILGDQNARHQLLEYAEKAVLFKLQQDKIKWFVALVFYFFCCFLC